MLRVSLCLGVTHCPLKSFKIYPHTHQGYAHVSHPGVTRNYVIRFLYSMCKGNVLL